jgi:ribose 5-phosphate isomerase B
MRIAVGADHAGYLLKDRLAAALAEGGHEIQDLGTNSPDSVDYPDFAERVGRAVAAGTAERGLLVCGTGIGMAISANKVHGVRAACCNNQFNARLARAHNDANVLTLGAREVAFEHAAAIAETFLATAYEGGRHQRRLDKIHALETAAE